MDIAIVYMVAGLSSRFGGQIKSFAPVGPSGETLMEYSLSQALLAGFTKIIFIVSEKTETAFKEKFGANYKGVPVLYALQKFDPEKRDKPWGTVDALCSIRDVIDCDFVICNGDDIYGREPFQKLVNHLKNYTTNATIGYKIKNVLSENGGVNRGKFQISSDNKVESVEEKFDVKADNLSERGLTPDSLCSMNIWGLRLEVVAMLDQILSDFKKEYQDDRTKECLLPDKMGELVKNGKIIIDIYPTDETWLGVTNPNDVENVRKKLA